MFDPDNFLNQETNEETSTEYTPIPEGEYQAVVDEVKGRQTDDYTVLDVTWRLDKPEDEDAHGKTVRQSIFLDLTESGGIAGGKGKNVQLGRLRAAVNQNQPGQNWAPSHLLGQVALVSVKNVPSKKDDGAIYSNIKGVAALS